MHFKNDFILSDNIKSDVDPEARKRVGKFLDEVTEKYQIGPFSVERESKIGGIDEFLLSKCDNIDSRMFDAAKELLGNGYSLQLATVMIKVGVIGECRPETRFVVKVFPTERKLTQVITRIKSMWNSMERWEFQLIIISVLLLIISILLLQSHWEGHADPWTYMVEEIKHKGKSFLVKYLWSK